MTLFPTKIQSKFCFILFLLNLNFLFRLHAITETFIFEEVNYSYDFNARFALREFSRAALWENGAERLRALAFLIDPCWEDKLTGGRMLQTMDEALNTATLKSILCRYFCLKCWTPMETEHEILQHCRKFHREEMEPNAVGATRETTIVRRAVKNMKRSATGRKNIVVWSGADAEYLRDLQESNYAVYILSPIENPTPEQRIQRSLHDAPEEIPGWAPDSPDPVFSDDDL